MIRCFNHKAESVISCLVLHQDLQKYLDEAPDGVIYFSMGSNIRSTSMPESKRNAFLGAFSKLKQRILWKWESDTLPGQPSNVKLGKWLPQSDILGECCYTGKTVGISSM
jgi:UDP:flavonoid glycosyltransferase YjiC (YdhE family)